MKKSWVIYLIGGWYGSTVIFGKNKGLNNCPHYLIMGIEEIKSYWEIQIRTLAMHLSHQKGGKLLSILGFLSFVCYVVHIFPSRCHKLSIPKSKILLHWMQREMPWQLLTAQFRHFDTFRHLKISGKNSPMTQWISGTIHSSHSWPFTFTLWR